MVSDRERPMSKPNGSGAAKAKVAPPRLSVLGQSVRDLSFENIAVQKRLKPTGQPEIKVHVNLDAKKGDADNIFEVSLTLNVSSKDKTSGETLFLLELDYTGMFLVENVQEGFLHPFLMIECPRVMFPFVRRIVSDLVRDGGFPPFDLELIDFAALYQKEMGKRRAEPKPDQSTN